LEHPDTNSRNNMTIEEEMHHQANYQKKNMLWTLIILAAAFLFFSRGNSDLTINPDKEELGISTPAGEIILPHDTITAYALVENPDYGECIDGEDDGQIYYGTWKNDAWGEYELAVESNMTRCIVLYSDQGPVVVNFVSDDETGVLYEYVQYCCPDAEDLT